jgi:hypothetical protein
VQSSRLVLPDDPIEGSGKESCSGVDDVRRAELDPCPSADNDNAKEGELGPSESHHSGACSLLTSRSLTQQVHLHQQHQTPKPTETMKVTIKKWNAVATWRWDLPEDDVCGICQVHFDGTCPACKYPGDDCKIRELLHPHILSLLFLTCPYRIRKMWSQLSYGITRLLGSWLRILLTAGRSIALRSG